MRHLLIFFFFIYSFSFSQVTDPVETTKNIYKKLVSKVGNNFNPAPELKITSTQSNPAKISNGIIFIEKKLIEILNKDNNFESRISYVLSHELAHHYLDHGWARGTGFTYVKEMESVEDSINDLILQRDRVIAETQADLNGGFVAQISGYNSLEYANETLSMIYKEYGLKKEMRGYPSFNKRLEIIESNIDKSNSLAKVFEIGNKFLLFGLTSQAEINFNELIKNKLNTREIHNNLGVTYLLRAINSSDNLQSFNYPLFIDNNTVAKVNTRSVNSDKLSAKELLEKAIVEFNEAIRLDSTYESTLINLVISKMLIHHLDNTLKKSFKKEFKLYTSISDLKKSELNVLIKSLKSKNFDLKKSNKNPVKFPVFKNSKLDDIMFMGFYKINNEKTYKIGKIKIIESIDDTSNIIEVSCNGKRTYFVEIFDVNYLNKVESIVKDTDYKFDRTIELGYDTFKVDLFNKIALKYRGGKFNSVFIYSRE